MLKPCELISSKIFEDIGSKDTCVALHGTHGDIEKSGWLVSIRKWNHNNVDYDFIGYVV